MSVCWIDGVHFSFGKDPCLQAQEATFGGRDLGGTAGDDRVQIHGTIESNGELVE